MTEKDAIRERYRQERDKRLVPWRTATQELVGQYSHLLDDPHNPRIERDPVNDEVDVVVIGAGFGGVLAGAKLREAGVERIRLIDRAGDVGGVWYWNRYPGAECDIESYIYLPFLEEMGYIPSRKYAGSSEIYAHTQAIADRYDLRRDALFHTGVESATWDEESSTWVITTDRGDEIRSQFVVMAIGFLANPKIPGVPGLDSFQGHMFHTSRWDYAYTGGDPEGGELVGLKDKVVGVVGTSGTGIQCIPPLGRAAKQLYIFQRTPRMVSFRGNAPTDPEWVAGLEPGWQRKRMKNFMALSVGQADETGLDLVNDGWTTLFGRVAAGAVADDDAVESVRARIDEIVEDPETAAALKPYYSYLCGRPCFHDDYLPTFNRPNVSLVDCPAGIERMTEHGLVANGKEYELDCLVLATGFQLEVKYRESSASMVTGRDGVNLGEKWTNEFATLYGLMTSGFPNLFIVPGSQSQSAVTHNFTETLVEVAEHYAYVVSELRSRGVRSFDVDPAAEQDWVNQIIETAPLTRAREFLLACTPNRFNGEGAVEALDPRHAYYGGGWQGSPAYFELLANVRAERRLDGLVLSNDPVQTG